MIKDNQTLLNRIHVVVDALVIACTYIAAWFIQFEFFAPDVAGKLPLETYVSPGHSDTGAAVALSCIQPVHAKTGAGTKT